MVSNIKHLITNVVISKRNKSRTPKATPCTAVPPVVADTTLMKYRKETYEHIGKYEHIRT